MAVLYTLLVVLVILAAINWGYVAITGDCDKDLLSVIVDSERRRLIYGLYGIAGLLLVVVIWQRESFGEKLTKVGDVLGGKQAPYQVQYIPQRIGQGARDIGQGFQRAGQKLSTPVKNQFRALERKIGRAVQAVKQERGRSYGRSYGRSPRRYYR